MDFFRNIRHMQRNQENRRAYERARRGPMAQFMPDAYPHPPGYVDLGIHHLPPEIQEALLERMMGGHGGQDDGLYGALPGAAAGGAAARFGEPGGLNDLFATDPVLYQRFQSLAAQLGRDPEEFCRTVAGMLGMELEEFWRAASESLRAYMQEMEMPGGDLPGMGMPPGVPPRMGMPGAFPPGMGMPDANPLQGGNGMPPGQVPLFWATQKAMRRRGQGGNMPGCMLM